MYYRFEDRNKPVLIDNINIHVKSKTATREGNSVIQLNIIIYQLPSQREMKVKMQLSKDNSEFTVTNNEITQRDLGSEGHPNMSSGEDISHKLYDRNQKEDNLHLAADSYSIGPEQKIALFRTIHSNVQDSYSIREEGAQCEMETSKNLLPFESFSVLINPNRLQTADNQAKNLRQMNQTTSSNFNQSKSKDKYTKVRVTHHLYMQLQQKQYAGVSNNVRPKSQNAFVKISRKSSVYQPQVFSTAKYQSTRNLGDEKDDKNIKTLFNNRVGSQIYVQSSLTQAQTSDNFQNNTKEIFSRNLNNPSQKICNGTNDNTLRSELAYSNTNSMRETGFMKIGSINHTKQSFFANTPGAKSKFTKQILNPPSQLDQQTPKLIDGKDLDHLSEYGAVDLTQLGFQMQQSAKLSQKQLEMNTSEYSFESSFVRKSPYQTYLQYSQLKSQYHKNHGQNRDLSNLFGPEQQEIDIVEQSALENAQISNRKLSSSPNSKRAPAQTRLSSTHQQARQQQKQSLKQQMKKNLKYIYKKKQSPNRTFTTNKCDIDSSLIPDFKENQTQLLLKQRRYNSRPGTVMTDGSSNSFCYQPLFITAAKKAVGIISQTQKEQIINQKSDLAKDVLKISIDDLMRQRQKEKILDEMIAAQYISQIPNALPHEWTPKSSIMIEFQDPILPPNHTGQNVYQNLDSKQGSQVHSNQTNSHFNSQHVVQNMNQGALNHQSSIGSQGINKQRSSKVIYSFKGERLRKSQSRSIAGRDSKSNNISMTDMSIHHQQQSINNQSQSNENSNSINHNLQRERSKHSRSSNQNNLNKRTQSREFNYKRASRDSKLGIDELQQDFPVNISINNNDLLIVANNQDDFSRTLKINNVDIKCDNHSKLNKSSQLISIDHHISKEMYPHSGSFLQSLENTLTDAKSPKGQKFNPTRFTQSPGDIHEEVKDVNVTQISIKVSLDQKKSAAEIAKSLDSKILQLQSSNEVKSAQKIKQRDQIFKSVDLKHLAKPNSQNQTSPKKYLRKPPNIAETSFLNGHLNRASSLEFQKDQNLNSTSESRKSQRRLASQQNQHREMLIIGTEVRFDLAENKNSKFRVRSALATKKNQFSLTSPNHRSGNQGLTALSRYNVQRNDREYMTKNPSSLDSNINKDIKIQQELNLDIFESSHPKQISNSFERAQRSKDKNRQFLSSSQLKSETRINQSQGRELIKQKSLIDNEKAQARNDETEFQNAIKNSSNHQNYVKSEITLDPENDSSIIKQSNGENDQQHRNAEDNGSGLNNYGNIFRQDSESANQERTFNSGTFTTTHQPSNQQSRGLINSRQNYRTFQAAINDYGLNSSQDPATKRTVLIKHKKKYPEISRLANYSMNVQTGDHFNPRRTFQYNSNSIPQIQFVTREDISQDDIQELIKIEKYQGKKDYKQTRLNDLPRHSHVAPSVLKKNRDKVRNMSNKEKILKPGYGTQINFYSNLKENYGIHGNQTMISRNQMQSSNLNNRNKDSSYSQFSHDHSQIFPNEQVSQTINLEIRQNHLNNVKIPHPKYLRTNHSQLSTIHKQQSASTTAQKVNIKHSFNANISKFNPDQDESVLNETLNIQKSIISSQNMQTIQNNIQKSLAAKQSDDNHYSFVKNSITQEKLQFEQRRKASQFSQKKKNLEDDVSLNRDRINKSLNSFVNQDLTLDFEKSQTLIQDKESFNLAPHSQQIKESSFGKNNFETQKSGRHIPQTIQNNIKTSSLFNQRGSKSLLLPSRHALKKSIRKDESENECQQTKDLMYTLTGQSKQLFQIKGTHLEIQNVNAKSQFPDIKSHFQSIQN